MQNRTQFSADAECRTQMHLARRGEVSPEMIRVAEREQLPPETTREEVARGRMIIPANVNHAALDPMAIGLRARVKINANIGSSPTTSSLEEEVEKLPLAERYGADTAMDLSTGKCIDETREAINAAATTPIGTVPIYQAVVSRGGGLLARWMVHHKRENPLYERFDDIPEICRAQDVSLSSATACVRARSPTPPTPPSSPSSTRSETLADDYFKTAEFCSMCGPKFCPMHNFRDIDCDAVTRVIAERREARAMSS